MIILPYRWDERLYSIDLAVALYFRDIDPVGRCGMIDTLEDQNGV
jgi:hypothetical protein